MPELKPNHQATHFPWEAQPEGQLSIDVAETPEEIIIQSAVAGVRMDDLDVFVQPEMITIRGTRHKDSSLQEAHTHVAECFWGRFSRTVLLPSPIDSTRAQAHMQEGLLTLRLPKTTHGTVRVPVHPHP